MLAMLAMIEEAVQELDTVRIRRIKLPLALLRLLPMLDQLLISMLLYTL